MRRTLVSKVMALSILMSLCCQMAGIQGACGEQICPLSRHNITVAEELMKTVQNLLEEVHSQGVSAEAEEALVEEAVQSLQKARTYSMNSSNCAAGNFYAIKTQNLLKKAREMLESRVCALRDEEYAVYAAFIVEGFELIRYKYGLADVQVIVVDDHTAIDEPPSELTRKLKWVSQEMPEVAQETLDNFQIKNTQSYPLENRFNLTTNVVLISREEVREIFEKNGWKAFYVKYPFSQGIMTLSRVGFNSEMNQALLYVGNEADDSVGGGYYVLLARENGVWVIRSWTISWVY